MGTDKHRSIKASDLNDLANQYSSHRNVNLRGGPGYSPDRINDENGTAFGYSNSGNMVGGLKKTGILPNQGP